MSSSDSLSGKQKVVAALRGDVTPRRATGPLAVHFCAKSAGVSLQQYTSDARVLADCVVQYYEQFLPDAVWLSADTWVTAEAMGAEVRFLGEDQPMGGSGAACIRSTADIDRIALPDVSSQGRFPLMLEALRRVREALGPEVFIVACFDQYPFSLACALLGIDVTMVRLIDDPAMVEAVMEQGLQYGLAYARALAEAGADMLSGGDSPAGLIGPKHYRDVALPFEQRLIEGLHSSVDLPVSLHICGDSTPILASMASSGADVLELDHRVNLSEASQIIGSEITIWGNLDPVGILSQGTVNDVRQATCELLRTVDACGRKRFVLSSGCTLPVETPAENIRAMLDAAREFSVARPQHLPADGGV